MIKTADLCDACDAAAVCQLPFTGFGRVRSFSGTIRTVRHAGGLAALRDLLQQDGRGQVLVIDGAGLRSGALLGDVMAGLAMAAGWAGIVVNGMVRDSAELATMQIGVKALGTVPRRAALDGPSQQDVPVSFGGATFAPGCHLVADDDGVVVLPEGVEPGAIPVAHALAATAAYAATGAR